ncbi:glycosyltransferase family 2 protein [Propionibacterium freudenreichii]|uniref:glycosyltransferase family 2 protein n=1 Tax=Propionibacterium freudenreichii TaxID=1744 RepID=UPI002550577A|nr:glycosyltransferase family 2 protein [Propionibacterium freudenreichii]MDK9347717.1 glycosyltransferase family 2 protein [Propionibacterium freudenreichii]
MTVDVLFPFYGDVALMKQAVHSVLRQSYRDFKMTVIDDGYPDSSIRGWFDSLGDDRISYERNDDNLGANGNFRKVLARATNELVVVMGSDDVMLPNYLQWLVDRADEYPGASIFQPGVVVIDEHGNSVNGLVDAVKSIYRPRGSGVRVLTGERLAVSLLRGDWLYFPSLGWRAETITNIGFREGYEVVLDLALALDVAMRGGSLLVDSQLAFMYRRHMSSYSSVRAVSGLRFDEERRFFENISAEMADKGWIHAARVARLHLSSRLHAASLLPATVRHGNRDGARHLLRHLVK